MKIYSITYNYNFCGRKPFKKPSSPEEKRLQTEKIKRAIDVFTQMPDEKPSYAKIADMTALSVNVIAERLNSPENYDLLYLYNQLKADDSVYNDLAKIDEAITELSHAKSAIISVKSLSEITGLSPATINNRLHSKSGAQVARKWNELKSRDVSYNKIGGDKGYMALKKKQMESKAFKMVKEAQDTMIPIKYSTIQKETGLSREEIDKVIREYPERIKKQREISAKTKELQAKWYEENQDKFGPRNHTDFDTMCEELDKIENTIKQLIREDKPVTIANISKASGMARNLVYARIHSRIGEDQGIKELYLKTKPSSDLTKQDT